MGLKAKTVYTVYREVLLIRQLSPRRTRRARREDTKGGLANKATDYHITNKTKTVHHEGHEGLQ